MFKDTLNVPFRFHSEDMTSVKSPCRIYYPLLLITGPKLSLRWLVSNLSISDHYTTKAKRSINL